MYTDACEVYVQFRRIRKKLFDGYIRRLKFRPYRIYLIILFFICIALHITLKTIEDIISYVIYALTII